MYSSDEDIFAENQPEEKKENINEFKYEVTDKKNENLKYENEEFENIKIKNVKKLENIEIQEKKKLENKTQLTKIINNQSKILSKTENEIIEGNNNFKPKRKIHISVVVDDKNNAENKKDNISKYNVLQNPEDILKRSRFIYIIKKNLYFLIK